MSEGGSVFSEMKMLWDNKSPATPPLRGCCVISTGLWVVGRGGDTACHGSGLLLLCKITCKKSIQQKLL